MARLDRATGSGTSIEREALSAIYRDHSRDGLPLPMARSGACHDAERTSRWVNRWGGWNKIYGFARSVPQAQTVTEARGDLRGAGRRQIVQRSQDRGRQIGVAQSRLAQADPFVLACDRKQRLDDG